MDVDDFADAHSASITKTLNTTRSDSMDTTMVFAHPASNGTNTFSFRNKLDENILNYDNRFWSFSYCSVDYLK